MNLYWPQHPFRSERSRKARRRARWAAAEKAATKVLLLSHGGCMDGIGAAVVTRRARDGVGVCYTQPNYMAEVLASYAGIPGNGRELMVADLSLQKDQFDAIVAACAQLRRNGWRISWRDHHHKQWEGLDLDRLRAHLEVLTVNADATESGASLQQQALAPDDVWLRRMAETIRDRDLWWNKTPDSETMEFALAQLGPKRFERLYVDVRPEDPATHPVVLAEVAQAAQAERDEQASILAKLLSKARFTGQGATRVGTVYGWLPKNTGLHELLTDHGCQIAINVRPNGKASLRSRKDKPVCHLVANQFSGGGHPNASGADLGLKGLAAWWYVLRRGDVERTHQLAEAARLELERLAAASGAEGRA